MTTTSTNPIQIGTAEQFAALRDLLIRSNYVEKDILERCKAAGPYDVQRTARTRMSQPLRDPLDACIRLFVDGFYVDQKELLEFFSYEELGLLHVLGLLAQDTTTPSRCYCPVVLEPVKDCYTIFDRAWNPDGSDLPIAADVVYPANVPNTVFILDVMPRRTCEAFLDLCAGTGIAALIAARDFARTAYALDIAERSTTFAQFNAMLNGFANVTALQGDLFEPVAGKKFDIIVAHPPYVPVIKPKWVFHDGGGDGEQIVRRLVSEVPDYLNPGGILFMQAMGSDRNDATFEERIRGWLGDRESEFDVAVVVKRNVEPSGFAMRALLRGRADTEDVQEWRKLFQELGIKTFVEGIIILQRRASDRKVFTVRRQLGEASGQAEFDWLLQWETAVVDGTGARKVLRSPLKARKGIRLQINNELADAEWQASEYVLSAGYPFEMDCRTEPWLAHVVGMCDGKRTGTDVMKEMVAAGVVHPDTPPVEFAEALMVLISGGFIAIAA